MAHIPEITVSSLDLQRLEALLASLPAGTEAVALQDELDRATVVPPQQLPPNIVSMNSIVQFVIEESGKSFTRTLVYPRDAGNSETLSILAPVGSALLGLAIGDVISWPLPGGRTHRVRIVDIRYQPERSGNFLQ